MIFWWSLAPTSGVFQSIPKVTTSPAKQNVLPGGCLHSILTKVRSDPLSSQDCLHRSRIYAGAWSRKKGVLSARIRNDQYSVIVLNKNLLVLFLFLFFFFFFFFFLLLLLLLMMTGTSLLAQMSFKVANERIRLLKHVKAFWLHMLSLTMSGLAIKMTQSSKQPTTKWQSEPAGMKRW